MQLLSRLAYRDGLTDLLNRTSYMEELKRLDASHNFHVLLALYDVNNLKYVNDTYGHQSGDEMIRRVADTLLAHLGSLGNVTGSAEMSSYSCRPYPIPKKNFSSCKEISKRLWEL